MKFKRLMMLCILLCAGCVSSPSSQPPEGAKDGYAAKLMIGERRGAVIKKAEQAFGDPVEVNFFLKGSSAEVEVRRYKFTNVSDFVAYFYKDRFIQANLMPVKAEEFPDIRKDYRNLDFKDPGVVRGYSIAMTKEEVVLDTILSVELKEEP